MRGLNFATAIQLKIQNAKTFNELKSLKQVIENITDEMTRSQYQQDLKEQIQKRLYELL